MKKNTFLAVAFLMGFAANSQNIYNTNGTLTGNRTMTMSNFNLTFNPTAGSSQFFMNGTTGYVGLGTATPTTRLDVKGYVKGNGGVFTSTLADGQTFSSVADRNDKCTVFATGSVIGSALYARMFNFLDFPVSNYDAKSTLFFGIEDRSNNGRYRFIAQTGGETQMLVLNKSQQDLMKVYEDGNDNVAMSFPKTNSRVVIGGDGTYLPTYKFVVRGSSRIEGDIITDAKIGIGTTSFTDGGDTYKLSVAGNIRANRVKVYTAWADYVFEKNYNLPTLDEVEQHIKEKGHLKDIPSAKEVESNGIELGEMNKLLLQKVEELTLYVIEVNKELKELKSQIKN